MFIAVGTDEIPQRQCSWSRNKACPVWNFKLNDVMERESPDMRRNTREAEKPGEMSSWNLSGRRYRAEHEQRLEKCLINSTKLKFSMILELFERSCDTGG